MLPPPPPQSSASPLTAWQYRSTVIPRECLVTLHTFPLPLLSDISPPSLRLSLSLLGPDDGRVVGGVRQRSVLAVVQEAVAPAAVADEEEGGKEDQGTDGAGLPLQQEAEQVEAHKHGVVEPQGRVQRFGDEQHGEQPL